MSIVIAKNPTPADILIGDLGISIPTGNQVILSDYFSFDEITDSPNLQTLVQDGNIIINNNISDLSEIDGLDYITIETLPSDPDKPIWNANRLRFESVSPAKPIAGQALRYRTSNVTPLNVVSEVMTSNNGPGGVADQSSLFNNNDSLGAYKAFNGEDCAFISDGVSSWISYEIKGDPQIVHQYSMKPVGNYAGYSGGTRSPGTWTFEGWNGSSWDILDTQTDISVWDEGVEVGPFSISSPASYQKYRLNVTHTSDGTSVLTSGWTSIGELKLLNVPEGQFEYEDLAVSAIPPPVGWLGFMVMALYWSKSNVTRGDWIDVSGITDSTASHQFPFPVVIRDTLGWAKRCRFGNIELELWIDDTNMGTHFTFTQNSQPQTLFLNQLDVAVPAGSRIRLKVANIPGSSRIDNLLVNFIVERIG